tara:strand:- start:1765 stop:2529 length:765 start_codon:yes stop_codon:yes gene_type:complete
MEVITCLWIQDSLDDISDKCIRSWIAVGYEVHLYTYSDRFYTTIEDNLIVKDANEICEEKELDKTHQADYFRFTLFKKNKEKSSLIPFSIIWCDTDQFLFKKLPMICNYVSTQENLKAGAFKCNKDSKPNIGVMKFNGNESIDWSKIVDLKRKKGSKMESKYLKEYVKQIEMSKDVILLPTVACCGVHWSQVKDLYTCKYFKKQCLFGVLQRQIEDLVNEDDVYGIHLWRQLARKKKYDVKDNSILDTIYKNFL